MGEAIQRRFTIDVTAEQLDVLGEIIDSAASAVQREIAHTDAREYRAALVVRRSVIEALRQMLARPDVGDPLAESSPGSGSPISVKDG